jgi:carboxyl-terminal processing protease
VGTELQQRTAKQFVRGLDPSRNLLLASDAARLEQRLQTVFATSERGLCAALGSAMELVVQRTQEDLAYVRSVLSPDFELDESVELVIDPDARGWPKTAAERQDLVRRQVHFQMSSYLTGGLEVAKAKSQLIHRYELAVKRSEEQRDRKKGPERFASAFALALDPHSSYLSKDDLDDFQIQMQLSLEGIGAALRTEDGFTYIESLIPGGAAEQTEKLQPKDKIIAVAQDGDQPVSTIDLSIRDVVKMIRGPKGTKVTLTVLREGKTTRTFDVTIVRDKIDVAQQAAKLDFETRKVGDRSLKIGVLELPSFYGGEEGRSSYIDTRNLVRQAVEAKVDGLVLDISRNGGGLLRDAVRISGLFIRRGGVVATKDTREFEVLEDTDPRIQYNGPLVVMVSPVSASGAEILAGALQAYRRAVIVGGPHTFGKGTVQAVLPLPADLGATKVTTGMFFLPNGESTQLRGVSADIDIPSLMTGFDVGEKDLDYALAPQQVEPFLSDDANRPGNKGWSPVPAELTAQLKSRSAARLSKSESFAEIRERVEEAKEESTTIKLADLRRKNGDAEDETEDDSIRDQVDRLHEAFTDEAVNVLADWIQLRPATRTAQR